MQTSEQKTHGGRAFRSWRSDDEGLPPACPDPGQPDPEETVRSAQSGPGHHSLVTASCWRTARFSRAAEEDGEERLLLSSFE